MTQYGYMKLKRELNEREEEIMNENLSDIIDIDDWWMAEGQYNCDQFWRIFQICDVITAKKIDLNENQRKEVIHDIINIKFPNLTALNLSTNNIQTIDQLRYLDAPALNYLTLSFNNITEAKTLAKCYFPNLKGVYIHVNFIVNFEWLPLMTCADNMEFLFLQYDQSEAPVKLDNMAVLFKLKPKSLSKLMWSCEKTLINPKHVKMLAHRYPKIKLDKTILSAQ